MNRRPSLFPPLSNPFLFVLAVLLAVVIVVIQLGLIEYAYRRVGVPSEHIFALLVLSLLGS
jgi:uncharacterized membrane protein